MSWKNEAVAKQMDYCLSKCGKACPGWDNCEAVAKNVGSRKPSEAKLW